MAKTWLTRWLRVFSSQSVDSIFFTCLFCRRKGKTFLKTKKYKRWTELKKLRDRQLELKKTQKSLLELLPASKLVTFNLILLLIFLGVQVKITECSDRCIRILYSNNVDISDFFLCYANNKAKHVLYFCRTALFVIVATFLLSLFLYVISSIFWFIADDGLWCIWCQTIV